MRRRSRSAVAHRCACGVQRVRACAGQAREWQPTHSWSCEHCCKRVRTVSGALHNTVGCAMQAGSLRAVHSPRSGNGQPRSCAGAHKNQAQPKAQSTRWWLEGLRVEIGLDCEANSAADNAIPMPAAQRSAHARDALVLRTHRGGRGGVSGARQCTRRWHERTGTR